MLELVQMYLLVRSNFNSKVLQEDNQVENRLQINAHAQLSIIRAPACREFYNQ